LKLAVELERAKFCVPRPIGAAMVWTPAARENCLGAFEPDLNEVSERTEKLMVETNVMVTVPALFNSAITKTKSSSYWYPVGCGATVSEQVVPLGLGR
jgi:hypothetical protein